MSELQKFGVIDITTVHCGNVEDLHNVSCLHDFKFTSRGTLSSKNMERYVARPQVRLKDALGKQRPFIDAVAHAEIQGNRLTHQKVQTKREKGVSPPSGHQGVVVSRQELARRPTFPVIVPHPFDVHRMGAELAHVCAQIGRVKQVATQAYHPLVRVRTNNLVLSDGLKGVVHAPKLGPIA